MIDICEEEWETWNKVSNEVECSGNSYLYIKNSTFNKIQYGFHMHGRAHTLDNWNGTTVYSLINNMLELLTILLIWLQWILSVEMRPYNVGFDIQNTMRMTNPQKKKL